MKRRPMSKSHSRKSFKRTSKPLAANALVSRRMRGGIRW